MITAAVLSWVGSAITWFLGLLPTVTLPSFSSWTTTIADSRIWGYLGWANYYVPVDLAIAFFSVKMVAWAGMWLFEGVLWILEKFHIAGGGGAT